MSIHQNGGECDDTTINLERHRSSPFDLFHATTSRTDDIRASLVLLTDAVPAFTVIASRATLLLTWQSRGATIVVLLDFDTGFRTVGNFYGNQLGYSKCHQW